MSTKTNTGHFFEDFEMGQVLNHATPRTITRGDQALYRALYPTRFALTSSDLFARFCGFPQTPIDELILFHIAFGKTVPDISLNAVANLGYAECRFMKPVFPGQTITAQSTVIGLKQNSNGKTGVVYVHSRAYADETTLVAEWKRWVMVRKRNIDAPAPQTELPELADCIAADQLDIPAGLTFGAYNKTFAGAPYTLADYEIGEKIDHIDGVTLEEAEHMMATRLWQNTAKVHFNAQIREDGKRLIYGGHIISMARALSFNGLANAQWIAAINAGTHANPAFAGDTVYAWSEVLDKAELEQANTGALRLRTVAVKNSPAADFRLRQEDGKYCPDVLLDLDYWVLIPR